MSQTTTQELCAFCGNPVQGHFSIHRDYIDKGPQVPLCDKCGSAAGPSACEIWAKISQIESDRAHAANCLNTAHSVVLCHFCGTSHRVGEACQVCGKQEPRIAAPSSVIDYEERQAWDRYAAAMLPVYYGHLNRCAEVADELLRLRRQRFHIK